MILLDTELDSHPTRRANAVAPFSVPRRPRQHWRERIPTKQTLARFLTEAQAAVCLRGQVEVLLTTDKAIRRLNRDFRGIGKTTDVLSFPAGGVGAEEMAGELAISVPTALRQAAEQDHALTCELKVLILHGLLHLAGYNHETDEGQMARREKALRAKLRLPLGLIERADTESHPSRNNKDAARAGHPALAGANSVRSRVSKSRPGAPTKVLDHASPASRREATKIAPDGVRRGTRRTPSGESAPIFRKPRRGDGNAPAHEARRRRP